jgi:hypothetical protein
MQNCHMLHIINEPLLICLHLFRTLSQYQKRSGCGSARLERLPWAQEAGGSNPLTPTIF